MVTKTMLVGGFKVTCRLVKRGKAVRGTKRRTAKKTKKAGYRSYRRRTRLGSVSRGY